MSAAAVGAELAGLMTSRGLPQFSVLAVVVPVRVHSSAWLCSRAPAICLSSSRVAWPDSKTAFEPSCQIRELVATIVDEAGPGSEVDEFVDTARQRGRGSHERETGYSPPRSLPRQGEKWQSVPRSTSTRRPQRRLSGACRSVPNARPCPRSKGWCAGIRTSPSPLQPYSHLLPIMHDEAAATFAAQFMPP